MDIFERYFEGELKTGLWVNFISNVVYTISLGTIKYIFAFVRQFSHCKIINFSSRKKKHVQLFGKESNTKKVDVSYVCKLMAFRTSRKCQAQVEITQRCRLFSRENCRADLSVKIPAK